MSEPKQNSCCPALWMQCTGILFAAILLGWVYNNSSPLRVHRSVQNETPSATSDPIKATTHLSPVPKPVPPRTGVFNETLSMSIELPAATTTAPSDSHAGHAHGAAGDHNIPGKKWTEVKSLLDAGRIVLVDARLKAHYDLGHIPGAVQLAATAKEPELAAFAEKYPKNTAFVIYCGSEACRMSLTLAQALVRVGGFTNVSHMPGGYAEYTLANSNSK
jgi:rhodanese-related sulfurtransferase